MSQIIMLPYLHRSTIHCTKSSIKDPAKSWNVKKNIVDPDSFLRLAHTISQSTLELYLGNHTASQQLSTYSPTSATCAWTSFQCLLSCKKSNHNMVSLWWGTGELEILNSEMPHYNTLHTLVHSKNYRTCLTGGNVYITRIKPPFQ
jgi:hypothetical protein